MSIKKTHQMFIDEISELYGNEYEILSEYRYAKEKVKIRHHCSDGVFTDFEASPTNLLTGHAKCPKCAKKKKYTYEDMVKLFEKYDCQLLTKEYKSVYDKVEFICNKHPEEGVQTTTYSKVIYTGGCCNRCGYERSGQKQLKNISIEQIRKEFLDKNLILLDTEYKGVKTLYHCQCATHKDVFLEITYDNLKSRKILGCDKCLSELYAQRKQTSEHEIRQIVESLGLIYDHVEYTGRYNRGTLVYYRCPKHLTQGIQVKKLSKFKEGQSCPFCNQSHGEREIESYLNSNNIAYVPQKNFEGLVGVGGALLSYDFFLPKQNLLVEYQGIQHERPVELFQKHKDQFAIQQEHDLRKKVYAEYNSMQLLEIWYYDFKQIPNILDNVIGGISNE